MGKSKAFMWLAVILVIGFVFMNYSNLNPNLNAGQGGGGILENDTEKSNNSTASITLTICSWNIQTFGVSAVSDDDTFKQIQDTLKRCDVAVIQEIRDVTNTAFPKLCSKMTDYSCLASERKGRSVSKEQYGLLYKSGSVTNVIISAESQDYDKWERPPTVFGVGNLTLITLHSKPDDTPQELDYLDDYAATFSGKVIVLGDMNLDGSYYSGVPPVFTNWTWVIPNGCDSTVAASQNCYDRIWINFDEPYTYGIYTNITSEVSDHYMTSITLQ